MVTELNYPGFVLSASPVEHERFNGWASTNIKFVFKKDWDDNSIGKWLKYGFLGTWKRSGSANEY